MPEYVKYVPAVPFITGIEVDGPGDVPYNCSGCTWVPLKGKHALKYVSGFCPKHAGMGR